MPKALVAGQDAGVLTEEGAKLLDVSGKLKAGIPMCPPEGDAGTVWLPQTVSVGVTGNGFCGNICICHDRLGEGTFQTV